MPKEKQEQELSPLEELGQAINKAVEETGEIRGEVSFVEGESTAGKYPVTKIYCFLGRTVQRKVEYSSPWRIRERALQECLDDVVRIVEPGYQIKHKLTCDHNRRIVIIRKPKQGYGGVPIIHPSWLC